MSSLYSLRWDKNTITIDGSEGEGGGQILLHTTTNAAIINRFLPQHIGMQQETDLVWKIAIS